jgi:hypothetical protein
MTDKNPCDVLAERFAAKQKAGLLDVKFFLQRNDEAGPEEVCLEVTRLYEAVEKGNAKPLDLGDLNWRDAPAA